MKEESDNKNIVPMQHKFRGEIGQEVISRSVDENSKSDI